MSDESTILDLALSFPKFVQASGEYMGFDVPELHLRMADAFVTGDDFIGISAFRNSAKSYVSTLYAAWRLMLEPRLWILVVSGETKRAEQFSSSVAAHLSQLPWLNHLAPKTGSKSFNVSGISPGEWPSLTSRTSRGNLRGPRADLIILDDPISTRDKHSPAVREKIATSMREVPLILNPAGRFYKMQGYEVPAYARTRAVALFTPTDRQPSDFYQKGEGSFWNSFEVSRFPAVVDPVFDDDGLLEGGTSAWPERWPIDELIAEQRANPFTFSVERQVDNSPIEDERSLIRFGKIPQVEAKPSSLVCVVDPSGGADEYAYAIGGLVRTDSGTTLHISRVGGWRNMTPDEAGRELLDVLHEEKVVRVIIEENFPVASGIRRQASERKQSLAIETFKTSGRKETRLKEKLPTVLNGGAVSFDPKVLSDPRTVEQLRGLRSTPGLPPEDDRLDAIEFLVSRYENQLRHRDPTKPKRKERARFA